MVQKDKTPRAKTTPTERADARLDVELRKAERLTERISKMTSQVAELMAERDEVIAAGEYAAANPALSAEARIRWSDFIHPQDAPEPAGESSGIGAA